jgi:hypothetical protein
MRSLSTSAARVLRGGIAAGSLVGLMALCSGCGGYERSDMERDLNQFVPLGSVVEGTASSFDKGDGYPDDIVAGAIDIRTPGTRRERRIAIDDEATSHGWSCRQFYCAKGHINATIYIGVAKPNAARSLPGARKLIYDEIQIDASYYNPVPLLD